MAPTLPFFSRGEALLLWSRWAVKISIVTPSLNQAVFVERTLQSVLSQGYEDMEYVVCDGGSADRTVEILKTYDEKLRWSSQPDNGQADAVNQGIMATTGDIIGWLNSDDIYYPGALRKIADYFSAHSDIDVVYGMADHIGLDDRPFEPYPTEPWSLGRLQETCFICQPATFFRRSVVAKCGLLDPRLRYCMDYEYWLRLGATGVKFGYLPSKLAGSRMYAENKTLGSRVSVHAEINTMFRRSFGRVPDRWLYNYAHVLVEQSLKRSENPVQFVHEVGKHSILASLRWNRRISGNMLKEAIRWSRSILTQPRRA